MKDFTAFSGIFTWAETLMLKIKISWIPTEAMTTLVLLVVLAILAIIVYYIGKFVLFHFIGMIVKRTPSIYDNIFVSKKFLRRISFILPLILFYQLIPFAIPFNPGWVVTLRKFSEIIILLFMVSAGYALIDSFYSVYLSTDKSRFKPIKGYLQVIKVIVGFIAGIIILSILLSETPAFLLGGLGAASAILLLVFKDTILGFVASVQLSANDMVMIGDWITVDKYKADGDVVDISLSSVKVKNFDNTFTYVPTYGMVADSFQNWRGMQESVGRRIKRSVNININSVHFVSEEELEKFKKIDILREYINKKQKEIDEHNTLLSTDIPSKMNFRSQTNIGIYRAYIYYYLKSLPTINHEATTMVRQLPPSDNGIPIEVYAFSINKNWEVYEGVVADIFDHILVATQFFNIEIYQAVSGGDLRSINAKS